METKETLWKGRSEGNVHPLLIKLGESITLDIKLYREDLKGSYVHAKMLNKIDVLNQEELNEILKGLKQIQKEIEEHQLPINVELEDIHTHVEQRLKEIIGPTAGKLHTARSRNDQIALDTHLYVKRISLEIAKKLVEICNVLIDRSIELLDYIFPSYTHLQVAQPLRISHHLLAYFWMFTRDIERMIFSYQQANRLPLGCGAATGVNYNNDRLFLMNELGFDELYENSMDAVSSRDHILNFLYGISVIATHLSRLCEEIILFSSVEFSFLELPDSLTTGSSIMPQKKNPDLAELIRGKAAKFISNLNALFITTKGLPLTYNRDLQEDRKPLVESEEILDILEGIRLMILSFKVNEKELEKSLQKGFATATDLADALVQKKHIPFREAHHIVGKLVRFCVENRYTLFDIPKELRKEIYPDLADDDFYFDSIDLKKSVEKKVSRGGTSKVRIEEQIQYAKEKLKKIVESLPKEVNLTLE
jgi:argininosuccinate lyase